MKNRLRNHISGLLAGMLLMPVFPLQAASGLPFPASRDFDNAMIAGAAYFPGDRAGLRCWAAAYTTYMRMEAMVAGWGDVWLAPFQQGEWNFKCSGLGKSAADTYHFGIACPNESCPEGSGPYVSIGITGRKNALRDDSTLYYVVAHEFAHAFHFYYGYANDAVDECVADDVAIALGARDYFGHCR